MWNSLQFTPFRVVYHYKDRRPSWPGKIAGRHEKRSKCEIWWVLVIAVLKQLDTSPRLTWFIFFKFWLEFKRLVKRINLKESFNWHVNNTNISDYLWLQCKSSYATMPLNPKMINGGPLNIFFVYINK